MVQSIFEEMGGRYERQGEYILPCLTIPPEKEQSIDLFGRRHLDYLREYRKITYTNLLTSGRLNAYLADIDRQAQEHPALNFGPVISLPVIIFFDHDHRDRLYLFIGRKTFAAHIAYPAAANRVIIIGWTGINYSRIVPTAKRAFHLSAPVCPNRKNPGRFHPFLTQKLL